MTDQKMNVGDMVFADFVAQLEERGIAQLRIHQTTTDPARPWRAMYAKCDRAGHWSKYHTGLQTTFSNVLEAVLNGTRLLYEGELNDILDINATELFADENRNWDFACNRATFQHRDSDVCEFIFHLGEDDTDPPDHIILLVQEMEKFGCTPDFIEAVKAAKALGAVRVLFYV